MHLKSLWMTSHHPVSQIEKDKSNLPKAIRLRYDQTRIRYECREAFRANGHTFCPYNAGSVKGKIWADEEMQIEHDQRQSL